LTDPLTPRTVRGMLYKNALTAVGCSLLLLLAACGESETAETHELIPVDTTGETTTTPEVVLGDVTNAAETSQATMSALPEVRYYLLSPA
jgi:hypothetical protein